MVVIRTAFAIALLPRQPRLLSNFIAPHSFIYPFRVAKYHSGKFTMPATEAETTPAAKSNTADGKTTAGTEPKTTPTATTEPGKAEIAEKYEYPVLLYTIVTRDAEAAIKYYEKALGGTTKYLYRDNSGKIMHSVVATSYGLAVSINDYYESMHLVKPAEPGTSSKDASGAFNYISIPKGKGSADDAVERMREAGAEIISEPKDEFYGHRTGMVVDTYGVGWVFAHEIEKLDTK